ncbi:hypothetical protein [Deinococcus yunweiensis]|uniref:hypothetical protein n=1 Tax=Deinococcus yunweiensis TaxID=367282 RepID=UPI00398E8A52
MKRHLEQVDTADTFGLLNMLTSNTAHFVKHPDGDVLHPFTAAPVLQYVTQAALLAASDKPRGKLLTGTGLAWMVQMGHEVLSPPHLPDDVISKMTLDELAIEFFVPLVRHQGRLQNEHFLWTAAQQWQLFNIIPRRDHALLRRRAGGDYIDIPAAIEKQLGMPVEDVFTVACAVYAMNMTGTRALSQDLQAAPAALAPHQKVEWFVDRARAQQRPLGAIFTVQDLQTILKDDTPHRARAWLQVFSARPSQLKLMTRRESRYTAGELTFQVLPLENVPVARLGGGRYVIPNVQSFTAGLPHLCELQALRNWPARERQRLRSTLGHIQEIYLVQVTRAALAGRAVLIPEREYRRPVDDNLVRGPDLTIVEGDSVVMVESKAMLFSDEARVGVGVAPFEAVDARMTEVVVKAVWKAADLLNPAVRTYDSDRAALSTVDPARVITVIVHAEHLHGYNVTWQARYRAAGHPLHQHAPAFIALSTEEYTYFVDAARHLERPLHDLLREQIDEIAQRDVGLDRSVIEGTQIDRQSILRRQFSEFVDAIEERWSARDGARPLD